MKKGKVVKKAKKPDKLAHEMATEVANMTKYIGLDYPSYVIVQDIDFILKSFYDKKRAEVIRKQIDKMSFHDANVLIDEVDALLESGEYD